jgi:hypothetical protein
MKALCFGPDYRTEPDMAITTQGYIDKIGAGIGLVALLMVFVGFFAIDGGGANGPDRPVGELWMGRRFWSRLGLCRGAIAVWGWNSKVARWQG